MIYGLLHNYNTHIEKENKICLIYGSDNKFYKADKFESVKLYFCDIVKAQKK